MTYNVFFLIIIIHLRATTMYIMLYGQGTECWWGHQNHLIIMIAPDKLKPDSNAIISERMVPKTQQKWLILKYCKNVDYLHTM